MVAVLESRPPEQHGPSWTCPKTGLSIPKTLEKNLLWRQSLRTSAGHDAGFARQLKSACTESIYFWINGFVWTFRQKKTLPDGRTVPVKGFEAHQPFITWRVQDEFIGILADAIDTGQDVLIRKSREMGATWLCQAVLHHSWQFIENTTFLEASRKEEEVDQRGDMDCLFEKHRYIIRHQPPFLLPPPGLIDDKHLHLGNKANGSAIVGESTNGDLGRGGRKTAAFFDEFAAVDNGEEVDTATADTAACRIFNSTPAGPGTQFDRIQKEGRAKILVMPWWRHPEKSVGAHQILGPDGRAKWTGPWYAVEEKRRDRRALAQEVDMDDAQAGEMFFDKQEIEGHRRRHQKSAVTIGRLVLPPDLGDQSKRDIVRRKMVERLAFERGRFEQAPLWRLWFELVDGRPPQHWTYALACDISNGSGASNSVCTAGCLETGQIVGKLWTAHLSPEEFAEVVAFSGVWFGGQYAPAFLIWENNGPGGIFGRKLVQKLGYPNFYCQRIDTTRENKKTPRWGWNSNNERKVGLFGKYREALKTDRIINPCKEGLDEALDYLFDESGQLVPGQLRKEPAGGRALHGDHVVADALLGAALEELPKAKEHKGRPPAGSFAHRRAEAEKKKREAEHWGK